MRHFIGTVLGTVIGIFTFFFVCILILIGFGLIGTISNSFKPKANYVLSLDMRKAMTDHDAGATLFSDNAPSIVSTVRALHRAKSDKNIKGLFIRADTLRIAPASAEELRLAILDFKDSGKFVISHAQGFEGTSILPYQAISASDEIWLQDTSGFAVAGLRSETEFYGGLFEKFGVQPQFEQFHEYKNAVNTYIKTDFTEPHREAATSYLTSIYDNAVKQIALDRKLDIAALTRILKSAPHSAEAAKDAGMIDRLGHIETAREYARKKAGGDEIKFKDVSDYGVGYNSGGNVIAFIGGQGAVLPGKSSGGSPFARTITMGGDTIAAGFDAAAKDKNVKAIIFRVSSPGGSPSASDQILAALERAREAGKPVIVSMGQYAASGGYYVSAYADHIVAMPQTITGSIGVYGGKIALEDTFAKIGYNIEGITIGGEYGGVYSPDTPFTEAQRIAFRGQLQDIYDDFTHRVAKGRDLPMARVLEIAKGRVWTGTQAKEIGLVDELGGFMTALTAAKKLSGIDEKAKVRLKTFPRKKTQQEQFQEILSGTAQMQADIAALREITALPEVQAVLRARQAGQIGQELKADIAKIQ